MLSGYQKGSQVISTVLLWVKRDGGNRLESFDIPLSVCSIPQGKECSMHLLLVSGCQWRTVPADWKLSSLSSLPESSCFVLRCGCKGGRQFAGVSHTLEMLLGKRISVRKVVPFCESPSISISSILFSSSSPLLFLRAISSTQHFSVTVMYLTRSYVPGIIPLMQENVFITCMIK